MTEFTYRHMPKFAYVGVFTWLEAVYVIALHSPKVV